MPDYQNEPVINTETDDRAAIEGHAKGAGVFGESSTWLGVHGKNTGDSGAGVKGEGGQNSGVIGDSSGWYGVYGETSAPGTSGAAAVRGESKSDCPGVYGYSVAGAGVVGYAAGGGSPAGRFEGWLDVTGRAQIGYDLYVAGQITSGGHDYAESFDTQEATEPGTVLVIGEDGRLAPCTSEYDTSASGVVSGAGGLTPGSVLQGEASHSSQATLALAGQVYVKVDAGYGAIAIGDLLTTSPTEGCAMRVADRTRAVGAIIGKALTAMPTGAGLVRMLVVNS
ncbi:hypothetical protein [Streptomyces sp. NPDC002537]